jgi:hypothetical protein
MNCFYYQHVTRITTVVERDEAEVGAGSHAAGKDPFQIEDMPIRIERTVKSGSCCLA